MSEVKPKFSPKVQAIWDECGTYVETINPDASAKELEFFVDELIKRLVRFIVVESIEEVLKEKGYINE